MKRKDYRKPTMKVFMLKHQTHFLQVSSHPQSTMNVQYIEETWNEN